jgi:hypothetical protein
MGYTIQGKKATAEEYITHIVGQLASREAELSIAIEAVRKAETVEIIVPHGGDSELRYYCVCCQHRNAAVLIGQRIRHTRECPVRWLRKHGLL